MILSERIEVVLGLVESSETSGTDINFPQIIAGKTLDYYVFLPDIFLFLPLRIWGFPDGLIIPR